MDAARDHADAVKRLIVYAGANGAGKSTLREGGADPVDIEIDPDRIARAINPAAPRSVDLAAGKEALRLIDAALAGGQSLSIETTLTGHTILTRMQAAKDAGYDVTLRYVAVNTADTNIQRVNARARSGGHWIPPNVVRRRVATSLDNLPAAIAIADRSVLLDNSGTSHRQVLGVENGRITFQPRPVPAWLAERLPQVAAELAKPSAAGAPPAPAAFDPFGDRATRGYLRNALGTDNPALIARVEARAFAVNVRPALEALAARPGLAYEDVLATHHRLFQTVYPWAGKDRGVLAPVIAISKAGAFDLFAHPKDVQRGVEYGLGMGLDKAVMRGKPGEVFGALAFAHPFLDGNGRVLMTVHVDLSRRAGFHIDWSQISKPAFLTALTAELRQPGTAMDALLKPHIRSGPLPIEQSASVLKAIPGLNRPGPSPSM